MSIPPVPTRPWPGSSLSRRALLQAGFDPHRLFSNAFLDRFMP